RDGREVLLVIGDQRRVGLGGEPVGQGERAGGQGVHSRQLRSSIVAASSLAATAAPSGRIMSATTPARARVSGLSATASAADRDSVVGGAASWATPTPRSATRPAKYGWS